MFKTLDGKFEEIERVDGGKDPIKSPEKVAEEINYLYGRFLEGESRWENYDPSYFSWLQSHNVVKLSREQHYRLRLDCIGIRISHLTESNQAKDLVVLEQYQKFPDRLLEADKMILERTINKRGLYFFLIELKKSKSEEFDISNKATVTSEVICKSG